MPFFKTVQYDCRVPNDSIQHFEMYLYYFRYSNINHYVNKQKINKFYCCQKNKKTNELKFQIFKQLLICFGEGGGLWILILLTAFGKRPLADIDVRCLYL